MKRGYIILIAGAGLFVIGIVLTIIYGINLATSFLSENIIFSDTIIEPSSSVNRSLQITDLERQVSVAIHVEREDEELLRQANVSVVQEVISPSGTVINKNEFINRDDDGLFTTFVPNLQGNYTIRISNLGMDVVSVGGMFGYLPIGGQNNQMNLQPIYGIVIGIVLSILGILTLIAGGIITIIDRKRK